MIIPHTNDCLVKLQQGCIGPVLGGRTVCWFSESDSDLVSQVYLMKISSLSLIYIYERKIYIYIYDPTHPTLCKGYLTKKESDGVPDQITWPPQSPDLNPIEGEAAKKCSAYVGTPSRLLQNHSSHSWLREWQECHQGKGWVLWRIKNIFWFV